MAFIYHSCGVTKRDDCVMREGLNFDCNSRIQPTTIGNHPRAKQRTVATYIELYSSLILLCREESTSSFLTLISDPITLQTRYLGI